MCTHISSFLLPWLLSATLFLPACASEHSSTSAIATNRDTPGSQINSQYRHKSETDIATMSPPQLVEEYADEQAYHKYDVLDEQPQLISKYILRYELKVVPRVIEIIDEYDPTSLSGKANHKGERFDAMWMLLSDLDNRVVRLRAFPQGAQAIDAIGRAIERMQAAGYGRADQHEWTEHGRSESAKATLDDLKGINAADEAIKDTLWVNYRLKISNKELLAFTSFLVVQDPHYPGWSEKDLVKDYSRINIAGNPAQVYVMKNPKRFRAAYLDFKRTKR